MPELIAHDVAASGFFQQDASEKSERPEALCCLLVDPFFKERLRDWICELPFGVAFGTVDGEILAANALFAIAAGNDTKGDWRLLFELPPNLAEASELILEKDGQSRPWHISRLSGKHLFIVVEDSSRQGHARADANFVREWIRLKLFELERRHRARGSFEASKGVLYALLDSLSDEIVVVDGAGRILMAGEPWREFARKVSLLTDSKVAGANYIALLETIMDGTAEERLKLISGVKDVISGCLGEFQHDFAFFEEGRRRWFKLQVSPVPALRSDAVLIVQRDVTNQRASEHGLLERDALARRVIEDSQDGIFLYDLEGRFVMTNPANARVLGANCSDIIGKTLEEVFPAEIAQVVQEQNLLVLSTGRSLEFELPLATPDGRRIVLVRKSLYRNHAAEVVGIFGIARDITERKHAEEALERSEHHFRALIENSADRLALLAVDGTILYASPSSKRISGYDGAELVGANALLWIHPDDSPAISRLLKELVELPGASMTREYRSLAKNGEWRWTESTITNLLNDPNVRALVVNERDISERKQADAELTRFAAIVESSSDAIVGADLDAVVTSWNPAAQRIFGYGAQDILGRKARVLIPADHEKEYEELTATALAGHGIADFETVRVGKGGKRIEVSITLSPIRGQDRQVVGISSIYRDITERRRLEKEILEISEREKQRLGQDLHDDLCQILVGISLQGNVLFDELCREGIAQAEDAKRLVELSHSAVDRARSLAKGLSPLALVDSGLISALEALVSDTERIFRTPCVFECNKPIQMKNATVASHLYRIAQEALHNAVKHSGATKVSVVLDVCGNKISLLVRDNGAGISEAPREGAGAYSGRSGGQGMHIMRYRARMIGAILEFKRNPDAGTSVICVLTAKKSIVHVKD